MEYTNLKMMATDARVSDENIAVDMASEQEALTAIQSERVDQVPIFEDIDKRHSKMRRTKELRHGHEIMQLRVAEQKNEENEG